MLSKILDTLIVKDIMASPAITIPQTTEFYQVKEKMDTHDIRHLPVVDEGGKLVGLITQRHLYKIHSPRLLEDGEWYYDKELLNSFILANVMIKDVYTVLPQTQVSQVVKDMIRFHVGCLVVIDDFRRPIGIVTRLDILKMLLAH